MLTSVEIHPYYRDRYNGIPDAPIVLPLGGGAQYFVKNFDGLGPTNAEIVTTSYVGMPGTAYQTNNIAARNPVIQVGVNPDYTSDDPFGELRRALYPYLNPGERVELRFVSDNMETVKATAYLESFEPAIFSADPMQTLSFVCPDPYFYSLETQYVKRNNTGTITFTNPGNARRTGFTIFFDRVSTPGINWLVVDGEIYPNPRYKDNKSRAQVGTYVMGDPMIFRFVTIPGQKSAGWMDSDDYHIGVEVLPGDPMKDEIWEDYEMDLLGYIDGWAYMVPGDNEFFVQAPVNAVEDVVITIAFIPRYVGL